MTHDELLKHSLLLTHGTIYDHIPLPHPSDYYIFPDLPKAIEDSWSVSWRANNPHACLAVDHALSGPMMDNTPIDVISWNAGPGEIKFTGMEIWEQCMTLFMRHI